MIFNCVVTLLVILMASYFGSQGLLTAMINLVCAGFASLLAIGISESIAPHINQWPDFSRGLTFLLVFLAGYLALKLITDTAVPKNIRLPKAIDKSLGGVIGIFAGMLAVGTAVLGIEMFPLPTTLLGYDRFADAKRMQGPIPGQAADGANTWLAPEALTMKFWSLASGRSLGGDHDWASVHPNLADENYGYRNVVTYGSLESLPAGGLTVDTVAPIKSDDPEALKKFHIQEGKAGFAIRCEIQGGTDPDTYFRVTASEVRLVSDKSKQYFPIGYMDQGKKFVPTDLLNGHTADDEPGGKAVEDWVFQLDPGEKPKWIEVKQFARVDLDTVPHNDNGLPVMAAGAYPQRQWAKDQGTITVHVANGSGNAVGVKVLVLRDASSRRDLNPVLPDAYERTKQILTDFANNQNGWHDPADPGIYAKQAFQNAQNMMRESNGKAPEDSISLRDQLPYMYIANTTSTTANCAGILDTYTNTKMIPDLKAGANLLIGEDVTDANGNVTFAGCPKGNLMVFAGLKVDDKYYMWCPQAVVKPQETTAINLEPGKAAFKFPSPF